MLFYKLNFLAITLLDGEIGFDLTVHVASVWCRCQVGYHRVGDHVGVVHRCHD